MPFLSRLQHWAATAPARPAVVIGDSSISYAELVTQAQNLLPAESLLTTVQQCNSVPTVLKIVAGVAGHGRISVLDPSWPPTVTESVQRHLSDVLDQFPVEDLTTELIDGPANSDFLIGLTSGTSSTPKGFSRDRGSWQRSFEPGIDVFGLREAEHVLVPGQLAMSLNLYTLAECLYAGATFHSIEEFDVAKVFEVLDQYPVQRLVLVPTILGMLARRAASTGRQDAVQTVICAGSKLEPAAVQAAQSWLPEAKIFEYYGASELGFVASRCLDGAPDPESTIVGQAFPGVELSIRDEADTELPAWVPGTIHVRSALVSNGYLWGGDGEGFEKTGQWCTVGDQGYLSDAGVLHFLGRRSDMLVSSGHNVYPHEIEHALLNLPGIEAAVVAGIPDGIRGKRIVAGVLPANRFAESALTSRALRQAVADVLAEYKLPGLYFQLTEMPVGSSGKINRGLFEQWIAAGDARVRRIS